MFETVISPSQLDHGKAMKISLTAALEDRQALAQRFDWIEACSVEAHLEMKMIAEQAYLVTGRIEAAIIQRCRLSGNPVPESIIATVEERFADLETIDETGAIDPMAVTLEPLGDGGIPLGEMIAQLVALEASPWPRDPEADAETVLRSRGDDSHPFASLAELKKNR